MSGISILRGLLLREAAKDSGQASGILSIGDSVRKLAEKRLQSYLLSAQKQGVDIDAMNEQQLKYILELNKPKNKIKVISQGDPEFQGIMEALLGKRGQVIEGKFGKPFAEEIKKFRGPVKEKQDMGEFGRINVEVDYSASLNRPEFFDPKAKNMYGETVATGPEFIKKEKERILNTINRKKNEMVPTTHPNYKLLKKSLQDQEDALEAIKITEDLGGNENMFDFLRTKNISDYKSKNLKRSDYVKTDDPEDLATGGRVGLKAGMSRRGFLKLMGGVGAGIGALKSGILKMFGKEGTQQATKEIIKTPPVPGKPEWFDSLVNKVILQGDDVTKKFAIKERQSVHKLQIDEMDDVTVYRNLDDGEIRVSYDSPNNMGEQPVDLVFKPGSGQMDEVTGKVADEFYAVEVEPRGVRTGPDDFEIEFDGENLASSVDELVSDTSKLKQVATDKKPTMQEFVISKNKKDKTKAMLYDIADDCSTKSRRNYTLNHFIERIKIYNEENFNYDIITIQLKGK